MRSNHQGAPGILMLVQRSIGQSIMVSIKVSIKVSSTLAVH